MQGDVGTAGVGQQGFEPAGTNLGGIAGDREGRAESVAQAQVAGTDFHSVRAQRQDGRGHTAGQQVRLVKSHRPVITSSVSVIEHGTGLFGSHAAASTVAAAGPSSARAPTPAAASAAAMVSAWRSTGVLSAPAAV